MEKDKPAGELVDHTMMHEWSGLSPVAGHILEVPLAKTSYEVFVDHWAAFVILRVTTWLDGSLALECKHLGCTDSMVGVELDRLFNNGPYYIHLCLSEPCIAPDQPEVDVDKHLHATAAKLWDVGLFSQEQAYVTVERIGLATKWVKEAGKSRASKAPRGKPAPAPGRGRKKEKEKPEEKDVRKPKKKEREEPARKRQRAEEDAEPDLDEEKRAKLRERLRQTRERLQGAKAGETPALEIDESDAENQGSEEYSIDDSSSAQGAGLTSGLKMAPAKKKERDPARRLSKKTRQAFGDPLKPEEDLQLAIRGTTTKSLSGQLVLKAYEVAQKRKKAKKTRKSKSSATRAGQFQKALLNLIQGKTDGLKKGQTEKSKKQKKRRRLEDGTIVSSERSCSEDSEADTEGDSSEGELEAPMQKKSRDHPGSVLNLLVTHIRQQMDQSALMDPVRTENLLTTGIQVMSYFNLYVKPSYPTHLRELRGLHHLSVVIDQLRSGDVARLGDTLAARYMAIHQSLVDGSWGTARHLELQPMEEASAAGAATILATRRHARLVSKATGAIPLGNWSGSAGKGRAGRGKGDWNYGEGRSEYKGEQKGKGKGKKGKGRWGTRQNAPWEKTQKDWERAKEKPDEKK